MQDLHDPDLHRREVQRWNALTLAAIDAAIQKDDFNLDQLLASRDALVTDWESRAIAFAPNQIVEMQRFDQQLQNQVLADRDEIGRKIRAQKSRSKAVGAYRSAEG